MGKVKLADNLPCTQYLSLEETEAALEEIRKTPQYPFGVQLFTYALISASFSLFFGGSVLDAVASGLIGVVLRYLDRRSDLYHRQCPRDPHQSGHCRHCRYRSQCHSSRQGL